MVVDVLLFIFFFTEFWGKKYKPLTACVTQKNTLYLQNNNRFSEVVWGLSLQIQGKINEVYGFIGV